MVRKDSHLDLGFLTEVCDDPILVELPESDEEESDEEDKEVLNNLKSINIPNHRLALVKLNNSGLTSIGKLGM